MLSSHFIDMKTEAWCLRGNHTVGHYLGLLLVLFAVGGSEAEVSLRSQGRSVCQNNPKMAYWMGPKISYMGGEYVAGEGGRNNCGVLILVHTKRGGLSLCLGGEVV